MVCVDVFIDHKSLKYVFNQNKLSMRQKTWLELPKDYDMNILYHPNTTNVVVDTFSKLCMSSIAHVKEGKKELAKEVY